MSHRRRPPTILRLLLLGAMSLGLALQPALASLGELHARSHDPGGRHPLAAQLDMASDDAFHDHHSHDETPDDHPPGDDDADPLHVLIHLAHCCGQSLAALPSPLPLLAHAPRQVLAMPGQQFRPQASPLAPFRPPIAS